MCAYFENANQQYILVMGATSVVKKYRDGQAASEVESRGRDGDHLQLYL